MVSKRHRYIIVLHASGLALQKAKARLAEAGVEVDESFPAVPVDGEGDQTVIRGLATPLTAERAARLVDAQFYPDLGVTAI